MYTANSIKVVPKKRKKVEYEREGLSEMTSFIPEYITIHRVFTKFTSKSCFYACKYKSRLGIPGD